MPVIKPYDNYLAEQSCYPGGTLERVIAANGDCIVLNILKGESFSNIMSFALIDYSVQAHSRADADPRITVNGSTTHARRNIVIYI